MYEILNLRRNWKTVEDDNVSYYVQVLQEEIPKIIPIILQNLVPMQFNPTTMRSLSQDNFM